MVQISSFEVSSAGVLILRFTFISVLNISPPMDSGIHFMSLGKMAPLVVGLLTGLSEVERSLIQEHSRESVEHRRRTGGNRILPTKDLPPPC